MEKRIIAGGVPETGGRFNLCVGYGNLIFVSGLLPLMRPIRLRCVRDAQLAARFRPSQTCPSIARYVRSWIT
jgi:hypothetical protein